MNCSSRWTILPFSTRTIPTAPALSPPESAVSKSMATNVSAPIQVSPIVPSPSPARARKSAACPGGSHAFVCRLAHWSNRSYSPGFSCFIRRSVHTRSTAVFVIRFISPSLILEMLAFPAHSEHGRPAGTSSIGPLRNARSTIPLASRSSSASERPAPGNGHFSGCRSSAAAASSQIRGVVPSPPDRGDVATACGAVAGLDIPRTETGDLEVREGAAEGFVPSALRVQELQGEMAEREVRAEERGEPERS